MSTFKRYVVIQAMTFVIRHCRADISDRLLCGQPDPTLKWMYWWGLFITAADVLIALGLTSSAHGIGRQADAEASAHHRGLTCRGASVPALDDVEDAVGVSGPDDLLVELADTGLRHFVDERPPLRQPESGDLIAQMLS